MAEVGKDLWRSPGPPSLLKQDHLQPAAQDHVHTAFEHLQSWRLHNLSGQPVPCLVTLTVKKIFPDVQTDPPVFHFVTIASYPITGLH